MGERGKGSKDQREEWEGEMKGWREKTRTERNVKMTEKETIQARGRREWNIKIADGNIQPERVGLREGPVKTEGNVCKHAPSYTNYSLYCSEVLGHMFRLN